MTLSEKGLLQFNQYTIRYCCHPPQRFIYERIHILKAAFFEKERTNPGNLLNVSETFFFTKGKLKDVIDLR